jgi:cyclophilin family peptidyl-prolyl cis-trans isomerase
MPFRLLSRWMKPTRTASEKPRTRLSAELLEGREVPSVTLASIADNTFANNKPLFVPVTNTATVNGTTTFTVSSSNPGVSVSVLTAGQSLKLDLSGVDKNGDAFTGSVTIRLFADAAPLAVQRIVDLANANFYDGKTFFRTQDNFVIQGGSSNNTAADPGTQPNLVDEYNSDFTFNSQGMVAFANAVDDANGTQFFITDIDNPLATRPQFLNFNHTIFGQLTSGFDVFEKVIQGTVKSGTTDQAQNPAVITDATIITDKANGVLRISAASGFTGFSDITVNAVDGDNVSKEIKFRATAALDPSDDRPFLNPIPAITVESGASKVVALPLVNIDGDNANLTYRVGVPGNLFGTPANVTTSVNAATGELTVTANSGFTGTVQLLVGVRDNTDRVGSLGSAQNFDTEVVTVNVVAQGPTSVVLTASRSTAQTNRTVLLTAAVSGMNSGSGQVRFLDGATELGSVRVLDGRALLTTSFATASTHAITAEFTPTGSTTPTTSNSVSLIVATGTGPELLTAQSVPAGSIPVVIAKNADGSQRFAAQAFEVSFTGGVRVAVADVTGDGQRDVISVPAFGGGPFIKIYDGVDGALLRTVPIFEATFRGGLYLDVKDALGLGYAQILVGAGFTGGPRVSMYDFVQDKVVLNYFAYDSTLRGGVTVFLTDLRGGEQFQILTAPGTNGAPAVSVFNPRRTDGFPIPNTLGSFFAGAETDRAGRRVGAGAIGTDGNRKIQVFAFDDNATTALAEFDPVQQGIFPAT